MSFLTVSAAVRLIPCPPARVVSRKQKQASVYICISICIYICPDRVCRSEVDPLSAGARGE